MTPIKKCYAELVSLTQLFLLREYGLTEINRVDPAAFAYFQKKIRSLLPSNPAKKTQQTSSIPLPISQQAKSSTRSPTTYPSSDPHPPETPPVPPPPSPLPPPTQPEPVTPEPRPPVIQDKPGKTKRDSKGLALAPLTEPAVSQNDREFWKLFPNLFPELALIESIPSDSAALKIKNAWLNDQMIPPVIILSFQDEEQQIAFLKNMAQAISVRFAPARVFSATKFENENCWENILKSPGLRLVIASDYGLYLQPGLMHFYSEILQQGKHFLNHIPLLLLSDLSLYLKEPQLKSLLWRAICNEFAASQHYPIAH